MSTTYKLNTCKEDHIIAWLAALAISIHILESAIPSPLPGIKPGFANIITVTAFIMFGWRSAAWVSGLRVLIGSLLIGTFLSPTFVLSLSGAIASMGILTFLGAINNNTFGPIGYCVMAALAHMATQIGMAYIFFIPHPGLFQLMPFLMSVALVTGIVSGYIVNSCLNTLNPRPSV